MMIVARTRTMPQNDHAPRREPEGAEGLTSGRWRTAAIGVSGSPKIAAFRARARGVVL